MNGQKRCSRVGAAAIRGAASPAAGSRNHRTPGGSQTPTMRKSKPKVLTSGALSVSNVISGYESVINTKWLEGKIHAFDAHSGEAWDGQGKDFRAPQVLEKFKRAPTFMFKQLQSYILKKCLSFLTKLSSPTVSMWSGGSGVPGPCMKTRSLSEAAMAGPPFWKRHLFYACALRN